MTTDIHMDPLLAYKLYCERFLIEESFRSFAHVLQGTNYRFSMKRKKEERVQMGDGAQDLTDKDENYKKR